MTSLCIIGAGSAEFTARIVGDLLQLDEFRRMRIVLHDIDGERLRAAENIARALAARHKAAPEIIAEANRKRALRGADFVQTTLQVGGYQPATVTDFESPKRYGLRQTIGDTLGIGGIMRGLRTIPVINAVAADIAEVCPDALWLQYVNPMAMLMMALQREFAGLRAVGLCHSVQGTVRMLADDLGEDIDAIDYRCAGINHMAFYTRLVKRGDGGDEDLYPRLRAKADAILAGDAVAARTPEIHGRVLAEKVRYEVLRLFGYFVTESSEHFAEYVPWFIKRARPELIARFDIPLDEYPARCAAADKLWRAGPEAIAAAASDAVKATNAADAANELSGEYAPHIMRAVAGGRPAQFNGNVGNDNLIPDLPRDACVEVPCAIDARGLRAQACADLPPQLTALMRTNVNVQLLTVEAVLTRKREHIVHAALLDPHTAAELTVDEICAMVDELIEAHGDWLPAFN